MARRITPFSTGQSGVASDPATAQADPTSTGSGSMRISLAARQAVIAITLLAATLVGSGQERFTGKVVGITDGDTISVMRDRVAVRVRLDGIDSPEAGQGFGQRAKQFASELAFGRTATVEKRDVDRYGRIVGRVFVDGQDLSLALVRAGLAWHYKQYSSDGQLAAAENSARASRARIVATLWPHPPVGVPAPCASRSRSTSPRPVSREQTEHGLSPARMSELWLRQLHCDLQDP